MTSIKETEFRIGNKYIVNSNSLNKFLYEINKYGFVKIYPYRYINSLYYDDPLLSSINENIAGITPPDTSSTSFAIKVCMIISFSSYSEML